MEQLDQQQRMWALAGWEQILRSRSCSFCRGAGLTFPRPAVFIIKLLERIPFSCKSKSQKDFFFSVLLEEPLEMEIIRFSSYFM